MRLKKFSLIAAAGLVSTAGLLAATATADLNGVTKVFGSNIAVGNGSVLTINVEGGATWTGKITGSVQNPNSPQPILNPGFSSGEVVKTGAGTLQIDSYKDITFYQGSFIRNVSGSGQIMLSDASQGVLRVKEGTVEVGGFINQYVNPLEFGAAFAAVPVIDADPSGGGFLGYSSTVLEGNARLSFTNSRLNIPASLPSLDGVADSPASTQRVKRLNFVVNLKGGDNNTEVNTRLNVGQTEDMILMSHVTTGQVGSVGILEGQGGQFVKTGAGEFLLLNQATFTGDVAIAAGTLTAQGANALATVRSVNFASPLGTPTDRNFHPEDPVNPDAPEFATRGSVYIGIGNNTGEFSPYLAPAPADIPTGGGYASVLKLQGDQTIHNLQSLFNTYATTQLYSFGKASGSAIDIDDGATLFIQQDLNGYYGGKFISTYRTDPDGSGPVNAGDPRPSGQGGGNIVKLGVSTVDDKGVYLTGTLALLGGTSTFRSLDIREGTVLANVQSLGSGTVSVGAGGSLKFIQNDVGTLNAVLSGVGDISFARRAFMMNNGPSVALINGNFQSFTEPVATQVGNGQIGTVDIGVSQTNFTGNITVQDGLQLRFGPNSGDAFRNANSLTLLTGANGEESSLTFNNTNQTFRNFSGQKNTRVDLGQGNITLIQDKADLGYEGKITGTGGLIKDGARALVLSGRDEVGNSVTTYAGATVVKAGTLGLGVANQLPNTSGLVMLGGTVTVSGDQRFGALFGTAGSTLAMGSGNLTIGLSASQLAQVQSGVAQTPLPAGNSYYLATNGSTAVSGYTGQTTRDFLASVTGNNSLDSLAFAGSITGSGSLIKQGAERLILTGVNTYTGATQINGGTLQVNLGSIDATSSVTVASGAAFAVNVDSGSGAFNRVISGAGNFEKTGAGTLTLGDSVFNYTGTTTVSGGTLALTLKPSIAGDIRIATGATLDAIQPSDLTFGTVVTSTVSGAGTFQKSGAGALHLTNSAGFTGKALVSTGTLQVDVLSQSSVEIASGATFLVTPGQATPPVLNISSAGLISGTGTFAVAGTAAAPVTATFGASNTTFTGTISGTNATIRAGVNDIFPSATIALTNGVFDLNGTVQHITSFVGDANSSANLGSTGELHFNPGEGVTSSFDGLINGNGGKLVKDGAGTQILTTPVDTGWTGTTVVNEGTLVATTLALGSSNVTINLGTNSAAPGTLAFLNNDIDNPSIYGDAFTGAISGNGVIGKTGVGRVDLGNASAGFTGSIAVSQGELHVSSSGIGGKVFGGTTVATGGTYAVVMAGNTAHDSGIAGAGNQIKDAAAINGVAQHGSLAVEGNFNLTLLNGQSYTGNTELRSFATLDLVNSTGLNGQLNGLAGDSTSTVRTDGTALMIVQSVDGLFSGVFNATTDLTVKGAGKLSLDNLANNIGVLTIDGGRLALDASLTNTVTLANGGTLYFDTSVNNQVYAGTVNGTGNMLKTGLGTLTLADTTQFTNVGGIGVDQGRLNITLTDTSISPNITGLISEGRGELGLLVDSGVTQKFGTSSDAQHNLAITGNGNVVKTGDGTLLLGDMTNPYTVASTGLFTVSQGTLGGTFTTSGALTVASGATLAPGNSPGLVTVNGNFTANGTLALEVSSKNVVAGVDFDAIRVNGTAILGKGDGTGASLGTGPTGDATVFKVTPYGSAPIVRGVAYKVISATGGILAQDGANGAIGDIAVYVDPTAKNANGENVNGMNVLVLTPARYQQFLAMRPNDANNPLNNIPNDPNGVYLYYSQSLASMTSHEGLSGLTRVLDGFISGSTNTGSGAYYATGLPSNALGGALAFANAGTLDKTVNALSPLGYASLYAMTRDTGLRHEDRIAERLEQRRYDSAGYTVADWETFVVGSAAMVKNSGKSDTPTFNYNTYGGLVGLDKKVEDGLVVGGAAGYDNGTATLHDSAGKMDMNRVRGTAFMSTMVNTRWFVDGGLSAGFGDFTSKRDTVLGRATGSTTGFDLGANVRTGTIVVLAEDLHLTPFVGLSYAHNEFQGFTEKGTQAALKVNGWSQDSLRASVGSGLGWWLPAGDWKWKLGVDASYNHELLDTDSKIDASFATLGGGSFSTKAAALPSDSISVGPNAALHFDDLTSVSAGVTFEYGFDGRTFTGVNVAFRRRF